MLTRRTVGTAALGGMAAFAVPVGAATTGLIRVVRDMVVAGEAMAPGTRFDVAHGTTLTITGDVTLPVVPLFTGAGRVDLTRSRLLAARPEWFGAAADDPAVDSAGPIEACLAAHPVTLLGPGDYHLRRTLAVSTTNRALRGVGRTKDARGTRLLLAGGGGAVVRVGTAQKPLQINDFVRGVELSHLVLGRTAAPGEDATGLDVAHVLDCQFNSLRADEHATGYRITGAVRSFVRDCAAFRSSRGSRSFTGFLMDGRVPPISTGANASLYLIDCLVGIGGAPDVEATGCALFGALSDTIIERLETTALDVGIAVDGRRARPQPGDHIDLHIRGVVLDQCRDAGIRIANLDAALVDIAQPYVALAARGTVALDLADCTGGIAVSGGQLIGVDGTGVRLRRTADVALAATKLAGFAQPVDAADSSAFDISVGIDRRNPAPGAAAVRLAACRHGFVRPRVTGHFAVGVAADAACAAVDIATAGIVAADHPVTVAGTPVAAKAGRVYLAAGSAA